MYYVCVCVPLIHLQKSTFKQQFDLKATEEELRTRILVKCESLEEIYPTSFNGGCSDIEQIVIHSISRADH